MGYLERADAADKRKAFWDVWDNVPGDRLTDGCDYCTNGWAHGPGLVYQCNCNETPGPATYHTEIVEEVEFTKSLPDRIKSWFV